jgi:hypothetical protein
MSDALDLRTAILPLPFNVRFWGECVAKLFPALRSRNNRILLDSAANQHCVFSSDVESIISPTRPQSASSIERDFPHAQHEERLLVRRVAASIAWSPNPVPWP